MTIPHRMASQNMGERGNCTHKRYYPSEDQSLSTAVLDAIEDHKDEDIVESDFRLYDDIEPDALEKIFRNHVDAEMEVQFTTSDVTVTLQWVRTVDIQVISRDHDA